MYRYLLAGTALATLAVPLAAQTLVEDKRTNPIRTSQLNGGTGGGIKVTDKGSIELTSGSAIIVDTSDDVLNAGKIVVTNADGASGIEVIGDRIADITNSGTITIDETYTATDLDNDKDLDGPFAVGMDRAAIRVREGLGGDIKHTGTINVEGDRSAGISVTGLLDGDLTHDGKTNVIGDDSVGVEAGDVTGNVRLAGTISVVGEGAVGARLGGDIDGAMVVQGDIISTGYRYTTPPSDPSSLDPDDLHQGGSALVVEGDVSKGILFAVAPKDLDKDNPDEDKDGIEDAKEGNAKVVSYGSAPAVLIGATDNDIAIGAVPATGLRSGIIVDGAIAGHGVYSGVDGNGMVIGGRGGAVTIENGIFVRGSIEATSKDANATALRLGAKTTTPELRNSGNIAASNGKGSKGQVTAIIVENGASLPSIRNSGTIKATAGDEQSNATAIIDRSGTVSLIENSGKILASGAKGGAGRNVAIDLSSVSSGATITQTAVGAGVTAPVIEGDIRFGSGDDVLQIADGKVSGDVTFGSGEGRFYLSRDAQFSGRVEFGGEADVMELSGTSSFLGHSDFGGGTASFSLSGKASYSGTFSGSQNVAVSVAGGTLDLAAPTTIASLDVGSKGIVVATLSRDAAQGTAITVGGEAHFDKGAKLKLRIRDIAEAEGIYSVIKAGSLSGTKDLTTDDTLLPFMYKAALAIDESAGLINVDIDRKATKDLGLNRAQASAYDALYTALSDDDDIADVFLGITDGDLFRATLAQALPDHAGGAFEGLSLGIRTLGRRLADGDGPLDRSGKLRFVLDAAGWDTTKEQRDASAYDLDGLGFSGGVELQTGLGRLGANMNWLWNRYDSGADNTVASNTYEAALSWRGDWGAFAGFARGSYGFADFEGSRYFRGMADGEKVERRIERNWSGNVASLMAGASVEGGTQYFFMRPSLIVDYVRLSEDGYEEIGGGEALDLVIDNRTSDEVGINLATAMGFDLFGMSRGDDIWMRVEAEGGWREIIAGNLGGTTARFGDGESFTLLPDQQSSGWFARLRGQGGDEFYTVSGELSIEERNQEIGYALRASLNFSL
ncbi:autotransporter outer membrane beta-barrel domain-containing protein [Qipengyuania sp. GH25]|uniref:Autotransporter outer membrane beta-barrel domain-containing protein n=1 Tax=Qipengyuania pacifica TaxID=2860199 RepID=A0ABS7JKB6_9SPHN|nr:autotransporter outer membrane beta-barrel domain-containing protein [Qipengyuania aerophila]MBX7489845.1 autotransporter outer membrane beta-barrel domain-containing protein [Qipengyuania aerophila]